MTGMITCNNCNKIYIGNIIKHESRNILLTIPKYAHSYNTQNTPQTLMTSINYK